MAQIGRVILLAGTVVLPGGLLLLPLLFAHHQRLRAQERRGPSRDRDSRATIAK